MLAYLFTLVQMSLSPKLSPYHVLVTHIPTRKFLSLSLWSIWSPPISVERIDQQPAGGGSACLAWDWCKLRSNLEPMNQSSRGGAWLLQHQVDFGNLSSYMRMAPCFHHSFSQRAARAQSLHFQHHTSNCALPSHASYPKTMLIDALVAHVVCAWRSCEHGASSIAAIREERSSPEWHLIKL